MRKEKDNLDERIEILKALGVTKGSNQVISKTNNFIHLIQIFYIDAWLQNRLLSYVMTLPTTEIIPTLEAISSTPTGGAMACRFLQAKWFDLQKRFGRGSINFAKVISAITKYGANKFDYDEVRIFYLLLKIYWNLF